VSITLGGVVLSAVITVLVMELFQTTPWLADKLMQRSVRIRYADNPQRAEVRGEELIGILEGLPRLFKLPTAGWFFLCAVAYRFERGWETTPRDQLLKLRVRRHWACLLPVLAETLGIVIAAFLLSHVVGRVRNDLWLLQALLWYIAVAAVLRLAWKVLEWWIAVIVVTDKGFMKTSGIIVRKICMMPFTEVTDLSFLRAAGGQVLGYGTLRVESGSAGRVETVKYLPRPEAVFGVISGLLVGQDREAGS
jgi:hypothetical protein